jgi:hypothetical protein
MAEIARMNKMRVDLRSDIALAKAELQLWGETLQPDPTAVINSSHERWTQGGYYGEWEKQRVAFARFPPSTAELHNPLGNMSAWYWCIFNGPLMHLIFLHQAGADLNSADTPCRDSRSPMSGHILHNRGNVDGAVKLQYALDHGLDMRGAQSALLLKQTLQGLLFNQGTVFETLLLAGLRPDPQWLRWRQAGWYKTASGGFRWKNREFARKIRSSRAIALLRVFDETAISWGTQVDEEPWHLSTEGLVCYSSSPAGEMPEGNRAHLRDIAWHEHSDSECVAFGAFS